MSSVRLDPATVYDCDVEGVHATVVNGVIEFTTGISGEVDALITNGKDDDVPPPGKGLVTSTFTVPAVAISATEIEAVSVVLFTYVVVLGDPPQLITDAG